MQKRAKNKGPITIALYLGRTWLRPSLAQRLHQALPSLRLNGSVGVG